MSLLKDVCGLVVQSAHSEGALDPWTKASFTHFLADGHAFDSLCLCRVESCQSEWTRTSVWGCHFACKEGLPGIMGALVPGWTHGQKTEVVPP